MKQFGAVTEEVLAEELGIAFNAEARQAWKNGMRALVVGISKNLKWVIKPTFMGEINWSEFSFKRLC